jgi:hypothetical protein
MIQLATDPNASRTQWRPAAADAREATLAARRPRSGHTWPFTSHYVERSPSQQDAKRTPNSDSGS